MSEIDRKSSELLFLSSFFADHQDSSVAAVISSALETAAAEDNIPITTQDSSHVNSLFYEHHHLQQQQENQINHHFPNNNNNTNQVSYTNINKNQAFIFGESVKAGERLVNNNFPQQQQNSNTNNNNTPIYHHVAPFYNQQYHHHNNHDANQLHNNHPQQHHHNNQQAFLNNHTSVSNTGGGGGGDGIRNSSNNKSSGGPAVDGNHVSGDDQYSRSSCSQFYHQTTTSLSTSQMADNTFTSPDKTSPPSSSSSLSSSVRDKSDNRETYQVSHCKEKSTCGGDTREVDTGGGGGGSSRGVFKPSSKIIDLPEKGTHHHHHSHSHHHHHSSSSGRSKDSRIPVGIAVAWQRLVTTSSSSPGTTSTMTTKAETGNKTKMSSNSSSSSTSSNLLSKHPSRPSSASSLKSATAAAKMNSSSGYSSASNPNLAGAGVGESASDIISSRPMSACGGEGMLGSTPLGGGVSPLCPSPTASPTLSRPLPSSSVPPNMGYPTGSYHHHHHQYPTHPYHPHHRQVGGMSPYLEYPYGAAQRSFAVPSPLTSPHHNHHSHQNLLGNGHPSYWGMDPPPVPLLAPGMPTSPGGVASSTDYLQHLSSLHHHQQQQQQMHLHSPQQHPHHHLHQQHLLATAAANRQLSSPVPSPSSSPYATTSPYLPFLYHSSPSPAQDSLATAVAAAAAAMNKSPYYDHYFLQQQQMLQGGANSTSAGGSVNSSSSNSGVSSNNSTGGGGFGDLLAANNNNSSSGGGSGSSGSSSNTHRAIPMQVASPIISRTNISLLSPSSTRAGEIRTPTPTTKSSSSAAEAAAATTVAGKVASTTNAAACVTSSACGGSSAFSVANSTSTTTMSSTASQNILGSSSQSSAGASACLQQHHQHEFSTSSPSPSSFFVHQQQHQHPHLFTSSAAALSPSLTSSTPSPVTVHDFNSGLNVVISSSNNSGNTTTNTNMAATTRKCATPSSPVSLTPTRALLSPFPPGSPFCPSPVPSNNNNNNNNGSYKELLTWKEADTMPVSKIKPIPINGQTREAHKSWGRHPSGGGSLTTPPPLSSPLLSLAHHNNMKYNNKVFSVSTPLSSPSGGSGQKHDFKRLESLIERRDSESISPLVLIPQHSPATSTTSSTMDPEDNFNFTKPSTEMPFAEKGATIEDSVETFRVSVKLEKAECQQEQRSNIISSDDDESFKVKPSTTEMIRHDDQAKEICMMKSETSDGDGGGESQEKAMPTVKVELLSPAKNNDLVEISIKSCDDAKNQHGGHEQANNNGKPESKDDDATTTTESNEIVEGTDVPESTLPLCSRSSTSSSNNNNYEHSFTDDDYDEDNNKDANNKTPKDSPKTINFDDNQLQQNVNTIKDISFTSGYCSSHEENNETKKEACLLPVLKQNKSKKEKGEQQKPDKGKSRPSLKLPSFKIKNQKKDRNVNSSKKKLMSMEGKGKEIKKGKRGMSPLPEEKKRKAKKEKKQVGNVKEVAVKPVKLLEKPTKIKKTLKEKIGKKSKQGHKEGQFYSPKKKQVVGFTGRGCDDHKKTKKDTKKKSCEFGMEKVEKRKKDKKLLIVEDEVFLKKGTNKAVKENKVGKQGNISSQQGWAPSVSANNPPPTPPMTNSTFYQQQFVNKSDNCGSGSSSYFASPKKMTTIGGTSVSGDISNNNFTLNSGINNKNNNNNNPDQQQQQQSNVSLTSNPMLQHHHHHQQPPMAVMALQSPTQVTFLITSPDRTTSGSSCGGTSPLRIPAYIPRSGTTTTTTSSTAAVVEELVGESCYNGPATLTLHRDVDATASPQQSYYPHHPVCPPAITIQYHHSAPATPLTMEAASPNSLDLLATVAQEFGSREDLGKRLSIDGASSCNASSIGESPPMSPQKSPASYHPIQQQQQHHNNHFTPQQPPHYNNNSSSSVTVLPPLQPPISLLLPQKSVTPSAVVVPVPSTPGKRPKSPKKQTKTKKVSDHKTSNSITFKQTSNKMAKMMKAGKKEKRTVSDSAAFYSPVVLLKIPQVPGLYAAKKTSASKESHATKLNKVKVGVEQIAKQEKSKSINNNNNNNKDDNTKPILLKLDKKSMEKSGNDNNTNKNMKKQKKTNEEKAEKKAKSAKSKSLLLLSLPTSDFPDEKEVKKKDKPKKDKKKKTDGGVISASSLLLSPLNTNKKITPTFSKDQATGSTLSPTKEKSSSFYNPPERISAFAKQVISRRSSAAATSPTKPPINMAAASSSPLKQASSTSAFFPIQQQQQSVPNSPPIKMPQLTPFDDLSPLEPPTPTTPPYTPSNPTAAQSSPDPGSTSFPSTTVPKIVNLMRFPPTCSKTCISNSSSSSHPPPPLLLPSVNGSNDKKNYCDDDDDARDLSSREQVKKKTDRNSRSPSSSSKISCKEKKRNKDNRRLVIELEEDEEICRKKKKKKKRRLSRDDIDDNVQTSKKKRKKSESSPVGGKKVPKITVTHSTMAAGVQDANSSTSMVFSPLTPPLTAKLSSSSLDGDDKQPRQSAFACLQVPGAGSTTPSGSSLASRVSSPGCTINVDDDGETETDNENFSNVWVADPMFAVSAIKLTNLSSAGSNQPTDAEGEDSDGNDATDSGQKNKIKVDGENKPPKLSLYIKPQEPERISPVQQLQQSHDSRERIVEVNSQLKAFVHFKPKQLATNKKAHGSIKPCLKVEPVLKSRSMEDDEVVVVEDDDEDFHLDMEVASITTHKTQNTPKKVGKAAGGSNNTTATSCTTSTAAAPTTTITTTITTNKKKKPSINRNSSSYSVKQHGLSTKEIMTKVFSRKVSPDLNERKSKLKRRRISSGCATGTEMDADDEGGEEEEEELLDIEEPSPKFSSKSSYHHHQHHHTHHKHHNPQIAMSAAAVAVVVNQSTPAPAIPCPLSSSSLALLSSTTSSSSLMKKPKKRSARSSTTSSCASTKSTSRGNRGQSSGSAGASASTSLTLTRASTSAAASSNRTAAGTAAMNDETQLPGKVELNSVAELVDQMRILTDIQGLFYTGRLNALQPPDVYGVTLDNERGAPPHLIFSAEEVLEKCLREKKPQPERLCSGLRICAYWSPQYSGLYPGRVSTDFSPKFDPEQDLIPIEFDDGDTGMIKLKEIRLLSVNHPVREYDPNPLLTLEKKHRKRRHSSATGTSGGCTGDHEEPDCGEPYCAKMGKLEDEDDEDGEDDDNEDAAGRAGGSGGGGLRHHSSSKMLYWTWSGLGYKTPKSKKNRNKEFFHGIQRGNEVINVGDAALFISTGNERPFIGRVERFWEIKGKKMVNVRWFYHPEEVKASAKRLSNLKYPGALFESPHIDENDVQTIAKKCDVLPFAEFKQRLSGSSSGSLRVAKLSMKSTSKPRDMYYVAGFYDPYTYNLTLKDLK